MLLDNCNEVACNPELGKIYSGITENLLGFKAGSHIIFYRKIEETQVEITRILHEHMDLKIRLIEK
jgi:toxin ParE1/3/4